MLGSGLLQEVAELLRTGVLGPRTTAGKSIGYRQTAQYLLAAPQQDAAAATDDDAAAEQRFRAFLGGFCTVVRTPHAHTHDAACRSCALTCNVGCVAGC